jgi:DNA-binding transcriptional ArsR family regulator
MTTKGASIDTQRISHIRLVTQDTRAKMLCLIRGHPKELPSLVELNRLLDEHKSTLYEHMELLIDAGLVSRYISDTKDDGSKSPYVFYGLTPMGYELQQSTNVFPDVETLKAEYKSLSDGVDIAGYADLDRPVEAVDTVIGLTSLKRGSK